MIRLTSEKKIDNPDFKLKLGTTNKLNPMAVYIDGQTFISPKIDMKVSDYIKDITSVEHSFRKYINACLKECPLLDNRFILDFSVAKKGLMFGKRSCLTFQCHFKQSNSIPLKISSLKKNTQNTLEDIIYNLKKILVNYDFNVYKSKKDSVKYL